MTLIVQHHKRAPQRTVMVSSMIYVIIIIIIIIIINPVKSRRNVAVYISKCLLMCISVGTSYTAPYVTRVAPDVTRP